MKVVLDTNVLISALLFHAHVGALFDLIESNTIIPCFTPRTLQEFQRVLERPKFAREIQNVGLDPEEIVQSVLDKGMIFHDQTMKNIIKEDPTDDAFLVCAQVSGAECIVSGDKHLLRLKEFEGIPIFSPKEFLTYQKKYVKIL